MQSLQTLALKQPTPEDCEAFIKAVKISAALHHPWVSPADNEEDFLEYIDKANNSDRSESLFLMHNSNLVGVFNISEIVRGCFQSCYLGYYAFEPFANQGYMTQGLQLLIHHAFGALKLHRIEANIRPENTHSIKLVQKLGFHKEGYSPNYLYLDGAWRDHERWAITHDF
ncbi:GNAT family N-acetyltransferase [Piscirickettsia litoralis]|uniref:Alanine acetyltransferase n=1 Tax=Piscirickettsia litoralis TaxID=1891921 RepID=A0ABX3A0Y4_9GAMM|nr:GNAT family N-acetyltransferase [Piscirickettsia litoralis]ODN42135.1 alanine acetyltransferase [Piscirickettsia litoralis]